MTDGTVRILASLNNPPSPPPSKALFYYQGVENERPVENGGATFELPNLPPGEHEFVVRIPEAKNVSASTKITVPEPSTKKETLNLSYSPFQEGVVVQAVLVNPPEPAPSRIVFYFQGTAHECALENAVARLELRRLLPGEHELLARIPQSSVSASMKISVKTPLAADKWVVEVSGRDGEYAVYVSVVTQTKQQIPGLTILIADTTSEEIYRGVTNEHGTLSPNPTITLDTPGMHRFKVFAKGTILDPYELTLEGPPRYKKPRPPRVLTENERRDIGRNPFRAIMKAISDWRQSRHEER